MIKFIRIRDDQSTPSNPFYEMDIEDQHDGNIIEAMLFAVQHLRDFMSEDEYADKFDLDEANSKLDDLEKRIKRNEIEQEEDCDFANILGFEFSLDSE